VKKIESKGYQVKTNLVKKGGRKGELYIYKVNQGDHKIVFSNNEELHKAKGAIIGYEITKDIIDKLATKIIKT
jgi:hypothetical protein